MHIFFPGVHGAFRATCGSWRSKVGGFDQNKAGHVSAGARELLLGHQQTGRHAWGYAWKIDPKGNPLLGETIGNNYYICIYISYTNTLGSLRRSKIIVTIRTKHHKNGWGVTVFPGFWYVGPVVVSSTWRITIPWFVIGHSWGCKMVQLEWDGPVPVFDDSYMIQLETNSSKYIDTHIYICIYICQ